MKWFWTESQVLMTVRTCDVKGVWCKNYVYEARCTRICRWVQVASDGLLPKRGNPFRWQMCQSREIALSSVLTSV